MASSEYCKNYSVALYATDATQNRLIYSRARCKMWSCEYCASVNRSQWLKKLIEGIKAIDADEWGFWTLTHDLDGADYTEQRALLSASWNRLIQQIKYHSGHEIFYCRAIEIGTKETRRMHLHVLINSVPDDLVVVERDDGTEYCWSEEWSRRIQKAGLGRILDIRDVSGTLTYKTPEIALGSNLETTRAVLAASYIAKYMSKTDEDTESRFPSRTRRFNTSRNWPLPPDSDDYTRYDWSKGEKITRKEAQNAWRHKLHVYDVQRDTRITDEDFDDEGALIE